MHGAALNKRDIEEDLDGDIDKVDFREGDFVDEHRSESVEEDLEGAEKCFPEEGIEEDCFEGGGEIGV